MQAHKGRVRDNFIPAPELPISDASDEPSFDPAVTMQSRKSLCAVAWIVAYWAIHPFLLWPASYDKSRKVKTPINQSRAERVSEAKTCTTSDHRSPKTSREQKWAVIQFLIPTALHVFLKL
eukprot:5845254-Amphidinium_carterae.1